MVDVPLIRPARPSDQAFVASTWAFTLCEIYLRRTFKGTTEELASVIRDVQAGKRKAPPYDAKEPPGLGPELAPR